MTWLVAILLTQNPVTPTVIVDPSVQSKRVTTTNTGGKQGLDVNCIGGCSGGGGGSSAVLQSAGIDGGLWQEQIVGPVNIGDAGVLNVNFPASQTVNGTLTALQGAGSDGGAWQVNVTLNGPVSLSDAGVLNVNFPATQAVTQSGAPWSETVFQGAGQDGGLWQVSATLNGPVSVSDAGVLNLNPVNLAGPVSVWDAGVLNLNPVNLAGSITIADAGAPFNVNPIAGASTDSTLSGLLDGGIAYFATLVSNQTNGSQRVAVTNLPPAPKRNWVGAAVVDGSAVTQPVSAQALPLPAGAAQESGNLAAIVSVLQSQLATVQAAQPVAPYSSTAPAAFLPPCNPVRRTFCRP